MSVPSLRVVPHVPFMLLQTLTSPFKPLAAEWEQHGVLDDYFYRRVNEGRIQYISICFNIALLSSQCLCQSCLEGLSVCVCAPSSNSWDTRGVERPPVHAFTGLLSHQ